MMSLAGPDDPSPVPRPLYQDYQGPPLRVPWAPRVWVVTLAMTELTYEFESIQLENGSTWNIPGGKLHLYWDGPPGIVFPSRAIFQWDVLPECQGLIPEFQVYGSECPGWSWRLIAR